MLTCGCKNEKVMINVTAGVIRNKKNLILVAKRKEGKHLAGYWELPGGRIEDGETPEECLVREIKEELDIDIFVKKFIIDSIYHYKETSICLKAYEAIYMSGNIFLTAHDEYKWIKPSDFNKFKFAPADLPILKTIEM